ncbi:enolase C-terminal domain-like protein [Dyadobacter frigoris]|uniref:L-alanine-DL-glutamate epimerase n=1 Tax=Dyadobacter frigoris TaxID=2576211 RepID=A0A4U6CQZ0_9BACT|nr:enolase C-terminal domain-like protein [Dyadobacter frigoris]TKT86566.1 L-alanine-DL-glutamate epimerase [Dyadobacter frigoris]
MNRRNFIKSAALLTSISELSFQLPMNKSLKSIRVETTNSNFERETLLKPFGFKGGYLTELWQTASQLRSEGKSYIGIATQSVLYGDADLFSKYSEAGGNALMYAVTERALQLVKKTSFETPIGLLDSILPELKKEAAQITGSDQLNVNFVFNALISVDNAAWLIYASENRFKNFDEMIPVDYRKALSARNNKVGVMFQVSYRMPEKDVTDAVDQGYFIIKIKTGQPGTQAQMLEKDKARIEAIHRLLKNRTTSQTPDGKLIYTLDANGRYEKKETLLKLLDHADKIGALGQILFVEEPLSENNNESVAGIGVRMAADESIHTESDAIKRLQQGYGAFVLKGIAKSLSQSMKIAKLAFERDVPCICADLTVNPILIDWNKNLAARLQPFPGLGMSMIETNGNMNYANWQQMLAYHPFAGAAWTQVRNGIFELDEQFYATNGGILTPSKHYIKMFQ